MKHLKYLALSLLLAFALTAGALAAEIPESLVVENLNGQQRIVKTYILSPETDPETLKEPSFEYDGFSYTWAYTTKEEHPFLKSKTAADTVTVETSSDDMSKILAELAPDIPYDDGEYTGELALDHTTISTVVAGYTTKSSTITETKVIGPVDRNDMSYVPETIVKDGKTLTLSNVEWQIAGTDQAAGDLVPASYQAVATYTGSSSQRIATGYVTTATYRGEVTSSGVENITYTVVYTGTEIIPDDVPSESEPLFPDGESAVGDYEETTTGSLGLMPVLIVILALLLLAGLAFLLVRYYKNVYVYVPSEKPRDYELIAKFKVSPNAPSIDITGLRPYPDGAIAIEMKRSLARKLIGKEFTVHHRDGDHTYVILQDRIEDWHEFDPVIEREDIL